MKSSERESHHERETAGDMILRPVGIIKSEIKEPSLAAGDDGIKMQLSLDEARAEIQEKRKRIAEIVINEDLVDALDGIEKYSHLVVLFWGHLVPDSSRALTKVHPMGREAIPLVGLFSTCSPARPNPVLITVVQLCGRKDNVLEVTNLDAVDGSPVIDIKPYVREFYPQEQILIPEWMQQLLEETNEGNSD